MRLSLAIASAAAILGGCSRYRPALIPLAGDAASLTFLTGHWVGDYRGIHSGRVGSIEFTLHAMGDSATGQVLMEDPPHVNVTRPADGQEPQRLQPSASRLLSIRFVGIKYGSVYGRMEPYVAPDCNCLVTTAFSGVVIGDTVSGKYITDAPAILAQEGVWRVVRRPAVVSLARR